MKTTFSRTFTTVVVILLGTLLLVGLFFQILVRNVLKERVLGELENNARVISQLAAAYYTEDDPRTEQFLVNISVAAQVTGFDAVICDAAGQLVLCSDSPLGCEHQGLVIQDKTFLNKVFSGDAMRSIGRIDGLYTDARYVVSVPITDPAGTQVGIVIVSEPMAENLAIMGQMSEIYLLVSVLVILGAVIIATLFVRQQSVPLRDMARAARAFGHGDLTARVRVDDQSSEETQELALAFNNMAASLQKSEYQRQEFVANVSHELKTPMTTIGGYLDGILDGTIPPEQHRRYMQLVSDETKRLSRLVRSMLDISRLQDQPIPQEKMTRFDIEECAGQVLITFEQKINQKALNVQVDMPEHPVYTNACEDYITQVVYNLVDNAVKFCPEGGELGLSIREGGAKIYVTISNEGDTIPPEELQLVFDRFHKLDKSRSLNKEGWGLGLYIVKTIVSSHGENISVKSQNGKTEFTFTLPLVN